MLRWIQIKRLVAFVLVLIMLSTVGLPTIAVASQLSKTAGIGQVNLSKSEILSVLEEEYGAEQAPIMLDTLQKLGLIDHEGAIVQTPIILNGQSYTLEEIKSLLEDPTTDLTQTAEVDGQLITLDSFQKMIEIEAKIEELAKFQDTSGVQISEEHLDNLESLIEQASTEGLSTVSDAVYSVEMNPMAISMHTTDDAYQDEVYATVTNIELDINNGSNSSGPVPSAYGTFYVTFQLNKELDKESSFVYELIGGSQGGLVEIVDGKAIKKPSMVDGPLTSYITDSTSGVVTFAPHTTVATLKIVNISNTFSSMSNFSSIVPGIQLPLEQRKEILLNSFWSNFARGDYLHFSQFKNLDEIRFAANTGITTFYDNDRTFNSLDKDKTMIRIQNRYYYPYVHSYEGGAYLAFTNHRNPAGFPTNIPYGSQPKKTTTLNLFDGQMLSELDPPSILEVQAKPGTYSAGEIIPMIVKFNRPMVQGFYSSNGLPSQMDDKYMTNFGQSSVLKLANGDVALPEMLGSSDSSAYYMTNYNISNLISGAGKRLFVNQGSVSPVLGFNAVVKKGSKPEDFQVLSAHKMVDGFAYDRTFNNQEVNSSDFAQSTLSDIEWNKDFSNNPEINIVPARGEAFVSLKTDKSSYNVGDMITFTIELDPTNGANDWVINGAMTAEELNRRLRLSVGDRENGLVTDLNWKKGKDGLALDPPVLEGKMEVTQRTLDLVTDANKSTGSLRAKIYYNQDKNNTDAVENFILLQNQFAPFQIANVKYIMPGDLEFVYPTSWPSGEENVVSLIDSTATQLGFTYPKDATYTSGDQFEWKSSDDSIASIQSDGTIVPKQAGTVTFTLTAKNNGALSLETSIETAPIQVIADGAAAIVIPSFANIIKTQLNQDATVLWSTNVMEKYKDQAARGQTPASANFTVELYDGNWNLQDLQGQAPMKTWKAPATAELINVTSFQIPGELLTKISASSIPSYTVRVSTEHPEQQGKTLTALAHIVVTSPAAIVKLDKSMGQFITDDQGALPLNWTLQNFDPLNKGEFEFQVTKNGQLISDSVITFDANINQFSKSGVNEYGGNYSLAIDQVKDANRAKDVYTITLKAKNSLDSTWSYDSLYLQVYKQGAFHIQIDGQDQNTYTMSNIPTIQSMTSDQILALKRKINLANWIGINKNAFTDLGAITDQFAWQSNNSQVASVYYQSGKDIDDISNFSNSSYQPKQLFTLGGVSDGRATITAKHVMTGIETELDLQVNTLKDKLYLFQFYPKTLSEITYTDGQGKEKKVSTNADGELALYDEHGIDSDVYVTSTYNGTTYTGILSQFGLKSQEGSTKTMDLYPVNILQLRQLAKVEVFFKKPDGQPYTGKITYFGGVYKNGYFAEKTEIGGDGRTETIGSDGRLEVIFDTTDFYSVEGGESNAANLSAKDQLEFIIEAHFDGDTYYPQLYRLDGDSNPVDMVAIGSKISRLTENPSGQSSLFMINQYVESNSLKTRNYITDYKGRFGPSNANPSIDLISEFIWWGQQTDKQASATLQNDLGTSPQGQSYQTFKYPFSKWYITRHVQLLNKDTIWLEKGKTGAISFKLYDMPDQFVQSISSPATLVNMIGVHEATAAELKSKLRDIKQEINGTTGQFSGPRNNDKLTLDTLGLLSNLKMNVGPLSMTIIPTDDPTIFRTFVEVNQGNVRSIDTEGFAVNHMRTGSKNFIPSLGDVSSFLDPSYVDNQKSSVKKNMPGRSSSGPSFSFGGYYIGEVKFNTQTGKWENTLYSGGFHSGGEFSYSQTWNMLVGPVPVTFSLTIGGGGEVSFATNVLFDEVPGNPWSDPTLESVNDYLTSLRIVAYIDAFGGIGFDFSVIAAKIGIFGKLTVENTSTWLNRGYLEKASDRSKFGNKLAFEGIVGVRVVLKFLFISFSHDFASLRYSHSWMFNHWKEIQAYWEENSWQPLTAANLEVATFAYMDSIGEEPMQVINSQTLENRDYLKEYHRAWNASATGQTNTASVQARAISGATVSAPQVLQSNAYPYSNPEVAADGSVAVYLSDGGSSNVEDTVASWMIRNGNGYSDQGPIATDIPKGYGDTNLHVAGEGSLIAAAWVRQNRTINKKAGEDVTNEEIMLMNNSAEVMVSIYNGSSWKTFQLTDNQTPDVAPVVSVSNGKVLVAYRSVVAGNVDNPLDFTQSDQLVYTVYDGSKQTWSETETLYNGTHGLVTGMSSEMLSDGRSAVVYTLDQEGTGSSSSGTSQTSGNNQIVYSVIDTDPDSSASSATWNTKGVIKNLQVTEDQNANENPKLTSARFRDGKERFILGWYTVATESTGLSDSNIRLLAIDRDGEIDPIFVDSLSAIRGANDVRIDPNFTFVRQSQTDKALSKLSLIWKTAEMEFDDTTVTTRDMIKAVKFGEDTDGLFISGVLSLGTLPDYTEADSISAYATQNGSGNEVQALLLGTTYTTDTETVGTIQPKASTDKGDPVPVNVSKTVSAMYTLKAVYENGFDASGIIYNPEEIIPGFDLPIQFNVVNQGMSKIDSVELEIDGQTSVHGNLSQAPNETKTYVATYIVPETIHDVNYKVTVQFADGMSMSKTGTITLDIPDLGISEVRVLKEENGHRQLSVPIYNRSQSELAGKGWKVQFGLYKDGIFKEENIIGTVQEISDDASLLLMDQGGYAYTYDFDVKSYLKTTGEDEIPSVGLNVFAHAWVVDQDGEKIKEFDTSNNSSKVTAENLKAKYKRDSVLLTTTLNNTSAGAKASLTMQNMNMAELNSGNVLVHLLDGDGQIIESKYVVSDADNLLHFGAEEIKHAQLAFTKQGEALQAIFFHENAKSLDASLSSVSFEGIGLQFDPDTTDYSLKTTDLRETNILAVASSRESSVTLTDKKGNIVSSGTGFVVFRQGLERSETGAVQQFRLLVKSPGPSGKAKTYTFSVTNVQTDRPELSLQIKGNKLSDGKYTGEVEVGLSAYMVDGFNLKKAEFKVNEDSWTAISYDGSSEQHLATLSEEGVYKVSAKVLLQSGQEYVLEPTLLEIGQGISPTPTPTPTPTTDTKPVPGQNPEDNVYETEPIAPGPDPLPTDHSVQDKDHEQSIFNQELIDLDATLTNLERNWKSNTSLHVDYADISKHWAKDTISQLIRLNIISGYPDHTFKPNQSITRAEFAALLTRLFVFRDTTVSSPGFKDVSNHWAIEAIETLAKHGVVKGYHDGNFKPNHTITREEMVVMLLRLVQSDALPGGQQMEFEDKQDIGEFAKETILKAAQAGIIHGYGGQLNPKGKASRAETSVMLVHLLGLEPMVAEILN